MSEQLTIRKVAVLGAGVMGAQIAAHFANCGIKPILYDLPSKEGDSNWIVKQSLKALTKLQPKPFALDSLVSTITPANYEEDLDKLKECDLIIEAISERLDWKADLFKKIEGSISDTAILATNTSGLSIEKLAECLPYNLKTRFVGIHFFNPPRYMTLVEIIPGKNTDIGLTESLESFLVTNLGKGVVVAKDTPNFIGNRVGVFAILSILHHAERLGLTPDVVDSITGPLIGRPKSATFRTMDVVVLDTSAIATVLK